jgi:dUTP pyrophosphatase
MYTGRLIKGTNASAGYDMYSTIDITIPPGERRLIPSGVHLQLNPGTFGLIKSRSGLSVKGIDVGAGVIDSDYRDEVKILLINGGNKPFAVENGMRVAQLIILSHLSISQSDMLENTEGGHKGFGSTGLY